MSESGTRNIKSGSKGAKEVPGNLLKEPARRGRKPKALAIEEEQRTITASHELAVYSRRMLSLLAKEKEICQGIFYITEEVDNKKILKIVSAYAFDSTNTGDRVFEFGEGFPGQVAKDGVLINISEVPDGYISIVSGLGSSNPASMIIFPVIYEDKVLAVIELASFHKFTEEDEIFLTKFSRNVAEKINSWIHNF
jgi:putative methionine-R-sulfoxide reductase with GAF domain